MLAEDHRIAQGEHAVRAVEVHLELDPGGYLHRNLQDCMAVARHNLEGLHEGHPLVVVDMTDHR